MSTASDRDNDLEIICKAIAEGKKPAPEVIERVRQKANSLRRKIDHHLSVELVRSAREE